MDILDNNSAQLCAIKLRVIGAHISCQERGCPQLSCLWMNGKDSLTYHKWSYLVLLDYFQHMSYLLLIQLHTLPLYLIQD